VATEVGEVEVLRPQRAAGIDRFRAGDQQRHLFVGATNNNCNNSKKHKQINEIGTFISQLMKVKKSGHLLRQEKKTMLDEDPKEAKVPWAALPLGE